MIPHARPTLPALVMALLLAALAAPAQAAARTPDDAAIRQVVEAFRHALATKDKPAYMRLFFSNRPEEIGWQFVSEDRRLAQIQASKPDAIKARRIPANTFVSLIDSAVATPEQREETFANIDVQTDGDVAAVTFDYTFIANGTVTNWGKELWQLVRTEDGWKIYSVVYSLRDARSAR
jgi:ketosteroid isomerase-like protein